MDVADLGSESEPAQPADVDAGAERKRAGVGVTSGFGERFPVSFDSEYRAYPAPTVPNIDTAACGNAATRTPGVRYNEAYSSGSAAFGGITVNAGDARNGTSAATPTASFRHTHHANVA